MSLDYTVRLFRGIRDAEDKYPSGGVVMVQVAHDTSCNLMNNGEECSCEPDISFTQDDIRYTIDKDGNASPEST